jgi:hypothetical protein
MVGVKQDTHTFENRECVGHPGIPLKLLFPDYFASTIGIIDDSWSWIIRSTR